MASVRKREWTHNGETKTAWVVNYTDQSGKRRLKTFDKKKDADKFRTQVEGEVERGEHTPDASTVTLAEAGDHFLKSMELRVNEGTIGKGRYMYYRNLIDKHVIGHFGKIKKVKDLSWSDIEGFSEYLAKTMGLSPRTRRDYMRTLQKIEQYAKKRGWTARLAVKEAMEETPPLPRTVIRTFTSEQVAVLVAEMETRAKRQNPHRHHMTRCLLHLGAFCGLRYGEIMGLTRESIDFTARVIRVRHSLTQWDTLKPPKTASGKRDVPMPSHVAAILTHWLEHHYVPNERELVFRLQDGRMIPPCSFHLGNWRPLLRRAGLWTDGEDAYHFHALRHFAASWMIAHNLPITDVASLLGHRTFDMTLQVYAHPVIGGGRQHDAIQAMAGSLLPAPRDNAGA